MSVTVLTPRYQLPQDIVAVDRAILVPKLNVTPFSSVNPQVITVGAPSIIPSSYGVGYGFNPSSYLNCGNLIGDSGGAASTAFNFTLSVTFTILANLGNDGIFALTDLPVSPSVIYTFLYNQSGNLRLYTSDGVYIEIGAPVLGQQYTLSMVYDGTTAAITKYYLNGVFLGSATTYRFWSVVNLYIGTAYLSAIGGGSVIYQATLAQGSDTNLSALQVESVAQNPAFIYQRQRRQRPGASVAPTLPTLSAATFVPGSITSTGFRPRVTAT